MRLFPLFALLTLSSALSQIAQPISSLQARLPDFKLSGTTLSSGSTTLTLERRGDLLKSATVRLPARDTRAAGVVFAALSGYPEIAQPFQNYLEQNAKALEGATTTKPVTINAEEYRVSLYRDGQSLVYGLKLIELPESAFNKVTTVQGNPRAPIAIRVFSDFQCPYCQKLEQEFLMNYALKLPKDVRLEFHQFPLEQIHPNARAAAEASECAGEQKKFWAYHEALFSNRAWMPLKDPTPVLGDLARKLKLNISQFEKCLSGRSFKAVVDAGLQEGMRLGVGGTPTVFVGPYKLSNPYDAAAYERLYTLLRP